MNQEDLFKLNLRLINIGGYVHYLKYALTNRSAFVAPRNNSCLLNAPKSERCYIIGLGPSLSNVDFTKLDGDTIVTNRFYKVGVNWPEFIPTYYLVADKAFLNPKYAEDYKDLVESYGNKGTKYLMSYGYQGDDMMSKINKDNLFYISPFKGLFNSEKEYRIDRVMPAFGNVVCVSIGVAIGMGYKNIVLLGCDFNSFASRIANHAYKEDSQRQISLAYELFCYSGIAQMHCELQTYALSHGVKIINSSRGSLIDAYPYEIDERLYIK